MKERLLQCEIDRRKLAKERKEKAQKGGFCLSIDPAKGKKDLDINEVVRRRLDMKEEARGKNGWRSGWRW